MKKKLILGIALLILAVIIAGISFLFGNPAKGILFLVAIGIFVIGGIIALSTSLKGKKTLLITGTVILVASSICSLYFLPNRSLNKIVSTSDIESVSIKKINPATIEDPEAAPMITIELEQDVLDAFIDKVNSAKYKNRNYYGKKWMTSEEINIQYKDGSKTRIKYESISFYDKNGNYIKGKQIQLDNTFNDYIRKQ